MKVAAWVAEVCLDMCWSIRLSGWGVAFNVSGLCFRTIGTVSACFRRLKDCYADMITALKNAQGPKKGAENKLVREFNQIFADYSAIQKQKATLKAAKKDKE